MLKPHCRFVILRNEKLFQPIWKQMFPENLCWVRLRVLQPLKAPCIYTTNWSTSRNVTVPPKEQMIHKEKPGLLNTQVRLSGTMWLASLFFHCLTLDYEHLLVESHRCLREGNIFQRQGRHLNTLRKSWAN